MTVYDYIVVGAGSAGCVVANRLTEDRDTTVLLLEAGDPDTKPEIQIPAECANLLGTEVDWGYFSEPEPYLNNRKMFCSRGKVLGGSSSINFMTYIRGNAHKYDHWQSLGNPGWSYQDVLPYFKKSEHSSRGASEFHGVDGELSEICKTTCSFLWPTRRLGIYTLPAPVVSEKLDYSCIARAIRRWHLIYSFSSLPSSSYHRVILPLISDSQV